MSMVSGRRSAIIDEIERRLNKIKINNGFNLDVALIQKRFPHLNELTKNYGILSESGEALKQSTDQDFLGDDTLPGLFLQYGNLGSTTDPAEVIGPNSYLSGTSRFANINQLEERFPIVIRGVLRESEGIILCPRANITGEEISFNFRDCIVNNPSFSITPRIGQIEFLLDNALIDPSKNDIKITVNGTDIEDNDQEDIIYKEVKNRLIYNITDAEEPTGQEWGIGQDSHFKIDSGNNEWRSQKIDSHTWARWVTKKENRPILDNNNNRVTGYEVEYSDPFKINEITSSDEIKILYRKKGYQDQSEISIIPEPNQEKGGWLTDPGEFMPPDTWALKETDNILFDPTIEQLFLMVAIKPTDLPLQDEIDTGSKEPKRRAIYTNPIEFLTNYQNDIYFSDDPFNSVEIEAQIELYYSHNPDYSDLYTSSENSTNPNNNWFTDLSDENKNMPSKFLYMTIGQTAVGESITTYSPPFLLNKYSKDCEFPDLRYMIKTEKFFKKIENFKIENIDFGLPPEPSPPLNASVKIISSPIPLTTLVSKLHTDVEKALYDNSGLLDTKNAVGLLYDFTKEATKQGKAIEDGTAISTAKENFADYIIDKLTSYLHTQQLEKDPRTIDLGITGVHDFIITDWYTLEGAGSPYEVIDFRLVIWHTYPKGQNI